MDRLIQASVGGGAVDVLGCACGIGTRAVGLAALRNRVAGSDLSPVALARAAKEGSAQRGLSLPLQVADLGALGRHVPGVFDVVLAADKALPHLLTAHDLRRALRAIAAKLRPKGVFLASIRDYDALGPPATWPARNLEGSPRPR